MTSISRIRSELERIPQSMWEGTSDPFERPRYSASELVPLSDWSEGARIFVEENDGPSDQDLAFLEQSLLAAKDYEIGIDSRSGAGRGIDALAWYVSFHHRDGPWGIFVPTSSLLYLELRHLQGGRLSRSVRRQVALDLLLAHELFHFATDCACAQWEILLGAPCWRSLVQRQKEKGASYVRVEEALANAHMLLKLEPRWSKGTRKAVRDFIACQPPGYKDATAYLEASAFDDGLLDLTKTYVGEHAAERNLNMFSEAFVYKQLFPIPPIVSTSECPIHIINDLARFKLPEISVRLIKTISEIIETDKFQKLFTAVPGHVQRIWRRKKEQLRYAVPRHPEFEKFRDHFSLRLGHSFRAHLRPVAGQNCWEAFEIGPHTKMGHG